jgi:hypothetical protein
MHATMVRMAAGKHRGAEEHRLARHAKRCHTCRMRARELGLDPLTTLGALRKKAAALLPIPWFLRRSDDGGTITGLFSTGANAAPLAERAVALVAAAALVGAGGAALGGGALRGDRAASEDRAVEQPTTSGGESQRGPAGPATDGERDGARQASGRSSGPAGGRAGGSEPSDTLGGSGSGSNAPSGGSTDSGSAGTNGALPSLPDAPTTSDTSVKVTVPKVPVVGDETTTQLPEVQLPAVQAPDTGKVTGVTGDVTGEVTNTLQNTLP